MGKQGAGRVVVALDASAASLEAVRWAARESQLARLELVLAHAFLPGDEPDDRVAEYRTAVESWHRAQATRWLHQALDAYPATPFRVRLLVAAGQWTAVLTGQAAVGASLIVAGAGTEAARGLVRAASFPCPLVVVPLVDPAPAGRDTTGTARRTDLAPLRS